MSCSRKCTEIFVLIATLVVYFALFYCMCWASDARGNDNLPPKVREECQAAATVIYRGCAEAVIPSLDKKSKEDIAIGATTCRGAAYVAFHLCTDPKKFDEYDANCGGARKLTIDSMSTAVEIVAKELPDAMRDNYLKRAATWLRVASQKVYDLCEQAVDAVRSGQLPQGMVDT